LASIHVWLWQLKGVPNELKTGFFLFRDDYLHDIETKGNLRVIEHAQPGEGAARDTALLITMHGCDGLPEIISVACLYLNEHQRIAVPANDIDFAAPVATKISI
jgi:hypothetical protein